jgi:pentatricopeptide repeat protein
MQAKGIEPDRVTYNNTIIACEKGGQWESVLELLEEMQSKGIKPDITTYRSVLDAVVNQRTVAKRLLKEALGLELFPEPPGV